MSYDVEDVFAGAFGSIIAKSLWFAAAIWIGCSLGVAGLLAGAVASGAGWQHGFAFQLWASPTFLVSYWGIPNLAFLLITLTYFVLNERPGFFAWGLVLGVQSLVVMAGWAHDFGKTAFGIAVAWLAWAALLVMVETGVWLIRAILINRWARQLAFLRAENARRNAERKAEQETDEDSSEPPA